LSLSRTSLFPGSLQDAYQRELQNLLVCNVVRRLWGKDPSLWPADEDQTKLLNANLSWLDLPERLGPHMPEVADFADQLESEGFEDAVFVGLSDSTFAAETLAQLSIPKRWKQLFVLDTIDPSVVRAIQQNLRVERTIFIFASKSGKRIAGHALLLYFLELLRGKGIKTPGRHFMAITEEHTYLAQLAKEYDFHGIFFDPPGIRGRYSGLLHFGLLLSSLCRIPPASLLYSAASMTEICRHAELKDANPAASLAAFLAAAVKKGYERLLLFSTSSLEALTGCVGQLVGVSLSKGGRGIVPINAKTPSAIKEYQRKCLHAVFAMRGDEDTGITQLTQELQNAQIPLVAIELETPEELGAELFKWEIATALACSLVRVNPFVEPDVRQTAVSGNRVLETLGRTRELPAHTVRVREGGIELYAEGQTRQSISTLSLSEALRTFFETRADEGYIGVLAFFGATPQLLGVLRRIGGQLTTALNVPCLVSFGPRYLHHLAQVFQGGPAKGLFLVITAQPGEDIAIPGAGYSFGQLQQALAMGDFEALADHHRPAIRLHLTQGAERGLAQLEQSIQKSVKTVHSTARGI
jgi:transaldolase / glucose-6-phosphate isomerase